MLQLKYLTVVCYAISVSVCYGVYCGGYYCSTGSCCTRFVWESYCCEKSTTTTTISPTPFYPSFRSRTPSSSFSTETPSVPPVLPILVIFFAAVFTIICLCVMGKSGQVSALDSTSQETPGSDSTNHVSSTSGNTESSGGFFGSSSNHDSGFGVSSDSNFGTSSNDDHGISSFGDSDSLG